MASPQLENGYTSIANEIMDALVNIRIPGEQMQCLLFILRKTYGWNKKRDEIALSQFVKATGIRKQHVSRALKLLSGRNIISITKNGNRTIPSYCFNKHYDSWKSLPKKVTVTKNGKNVSPKKGTTKETIQKKYSTDIFSFCEKFIHWSEKEHGKQAPKYSETLLKNSCDTVEKLIRLDGFTLKYIKNVLNWGVKDEFWSDQVRSLSAIRKTSNGSGLTKFQNIAAKFEKSKKPSLGNQPPQGSIDSGRYQEIDV